MRLLRVAEGSTGAKESEQFRILIRECVRRERVVEFLETGEWGDYFTKRGPISGVEPLNVQNSSKDILEQVADRIYKIRNRIVHAKDDPKYVDAPVLLPQSDEADALVPDVRLIRLLAIEIVIDGQDQ
ncbi:hypothetical protein GCM10009525_81910 [Streptosporangium amethystogenes subsp. fukuiense]